MNPYYELPNLGNNFRRRSAANDEGGAVNIDSLLSVATLRLVNGLEQAVAAVTRWRRRRAAVRELSALSDHHLADIGLHRSQIQSTVEEIDETGAQPSWRRDRSWHRAAGAAANDNDRPTAAQIVGLRG